MIEQVVAHSLLLSDSFRFAKFIYSGIFSILIGLKIVNDRIDFFLFFPLLLIREHLSRGGRFISFG